MEGMILYIYIYIILYIFKLKVYVFQINFCLVPLICSSHTHLFSVNFITFLQPFSYHFLQLFPVLISLSIPLGKMLTREKSSPLTYLPVLYPYCHLCYSPSTVYYPWHLELYKGHLM